jgi:hypothetical protein
MPVKIDESASLEATQAMYVLTHDVLHWLCMSDEGFDVFYGDMVRNFEENDVLPPDRETVMHNLASIHAGMSVIMRAMEELTGQHMPNAGEENDPGL